MARHPGHSREDEFRIELVSQSGIGPLFDFTNTPRYGWVFWGENSKKPPSLDVRGASPRTRTLVRRVLTAICYGQA